MNNLPYKKTSLAIKGFSKSVIAKGEKHDCVVRAIASAVEFNYEDSHSFVKKVFNRKDKKGVSMFISTMNRMSNENIKINNKSFENMGNQKYMVTVNGDSVDRKMTTGRFYKSNPKGVFLICVKGHVFTIKNGTIIGNIEDSKKTKKIVTNVWKVLD